MKKMNEEQLMFVALCKYMKKNDTKTVNPYNLSLFLSNMTGENFNIPMVYGVKTEGSKRFWRTYFKLEKTGLIETYIGKGKYGVRVIRFTEKGMKYIQSLKTKNN